MLLTDQVWAMLTCKKCGQKESHAANNKNKSFPNWGNFSEFEFLLSSQPRDRAESQR